MTQSSAPIPKALTLPDGDSKIEISPFDPTRVRDWYILNFERKTKDGTWKTVRHRYLNKAETLSFVEEQVKRGWVAHYNS